MAFQANAFQNNAFQVGVPGAPATDNDYQVAYGADDAAVFAVLDLVCSDVASFESVSTPPDTDPDVELPRPVFADDEVSFLFANDDWSPEWSQGPPDQDDEYNATAFDDDALLALRDILADPSDYESTSGPVAFPDDETGETTGATALDDVYPLPDTSDDYEFVGAPSDDLVTDDTITATALDDVFDLPADAEEHAAFVTAAIGDETGETTGGTSFDDVYPLPDDADEFAWTAPDFEENTPLAVAFDDVYPLPDDAEEHAAFVTSFPDDETGETPAASSFDDVYPLPDLDAADYEQASGPPDDPDAVTLATAVDDVYPLPDPADEHAWSITSFPDDETGETTGAAAIDDVFPIPDLTPEEYEDVAGPPDELDDSIIAAAIDDVYPLPADAEEHSFSITSFPDDETGETTGAASFDDHWIVPAPDVAEEFECIGTPLDDAPVIVDESIFAPASDDDEIAAAFIPPAAEEWTQRGTDEDDPNFAVPFPTSADDVYPLPDDAEEFAASGIDYDEHAPFIAAADDVFDLPDPADEHTGTPPDQDDAPAAAAFDDVYPLPDPADEHTGAGIDFDEHTPFAAAADDVFDLPADAEEHTATPVEDTPLEALGVAFDDVFPLPDDADEHTGTPPDQDDTAASQAADDVYPLPDAAEEHTAGPLDDLVAEASILATSFDDDLVFPDFVLQLAEPSTWATTPITPEPSAIDGVRIFEQARFEFGKRARVTEFDPSRRTEFMPSRVTEFEAPDRRTVFRSRLIVEGELIMTVLRNDLERTQKRTTENPSFVFNFAKFVNRNVTVVRITGTDGGIALGVTSVQKNVVTSTNLIVTGATFVGQQVAAFFDAGTPLEDYDVFATALMSDGQRLTVAGIIEVRDPT